MVENLSERGFIGEVVKAEMFRFTQHDRPPRAYAVKAEILRFAQHDRFFVVLERASASEGPHKNWVCRTMLINVI